MPRYKVSDPQSGRSLTLVGDAPPSEAEITKAFLDSANAAPLSEPTDASGGWWKGLQEGAGRGVMGLVSGAMGAPGDLLRNVKQAAAHPIDTATSLLDSVNPIKQAMQIPANLRGIEQAMGKAGADPEGFARPIGSQIGQMALTMAPEAAPGLLKGAGRGVEAVGKSPIVNRASTYGAAGAGFGGDILTAGAAAAAPPALRLAGRGMQAAGRGLEQVGGAVKRGLGMTDPPRPTPPPGARLVKPATMEQELAQALEQVRTAPPEAPTTSGLPEPPVASQKAGPFTTAEGKFGYSSDVDAAKLDAQVQKATQRVAGDPLDEGHTRLMEAATTAPEPPRSGLAGEGVVQPQAPHPNGQQTAAPSMPEPLPMAGGDARVTSNPADTIPNPRPPAVEATDPIHEAIRAAMGGGDAVVGEAPVFPRVTSWKPGMGPDVNPEALAPADVQRYRTRFGSKTAAQKLKTKPDVIKTLAPGDTHQLPTEARERIDSRISSLPPDEARAYADQPNHAVGRSYIEDALQRILGEQATAPKPPDPWEF